MIAFLIALIALSSAACQYIPEMAKAIDDISTDNAVGIMVSKEAIASKGKEIAISLNITNKING